MKKLLFVIFMLLSYNGFSQEQYVYEHVNIKYDNNKLRQEYFDELTSISYILKDSIIMLENECYIFKYHITSVSEDTTYIKLKYISDIGEHYIKSTNDDIKFEEDFRFEYGYFVNKKHSLILYLNKKRFIFYN